MYFLLNKIFFTLSYFIAKIQYVTQKICVNQWLSVRFPVSRQLLVIQFLGSQKLFVDFHLCPHPHVLKGQLQQSMALSLAGYRLRVDEFGVSDGRAGRLVMKRRPEEIRKHTGDNESEGSHS